MVKVMGMINSYFTNRELAIFFWLIAFGIWMGTKKAVRVSIVNVLKILFGRKMMTVLLIFISYVLLSCFLLYTVNLRDVYLLKDTVYWLFGVGFILTMNLTRDSKKDGYIKNILKGNLEIIILIEFMLNLYCFNLLIEIVLVFVLVLTVALQTYSSTDKKYSQVTTITKYLMGVISIVIIYFTVYNIRFDFSSFVTIGNLKSFLLPILLLILFVPFLYFFALYCGYETLFVRIKTLENSKSLKKYTKIKFYKYCGINLNKLNKFCIGRCIWITKKQDVLDIIQEEKENEKLDSTHT